MHPPAEFLGVIAGSACHKSSKLMCISTIIYTRKCFPHRLVVKCYFEVSTAVLTQLLRIGRTQLSVPSPLRLPLQGQRLRASGRLAEAQEVDNMAVAIENKAEEQWRKNVEVRENCNRNNICC